jgi:amino acid adenylation domain-containing protein
MTWTPVSEWFRQTSRIFPEKPAISWSGRRLTYGELDEDSGRLAAALAGDAGWTQEAVVVILADSPFHLAASILGILKAGGAFAPVDRLAPPARLAVMLEEAHPAYILVSPEYAGLAHELSNAAPSRPKVLRLSDAERACPRPEWSGGGLHVAPEHRPDALCYIYFTSGSSGRPKAIAGRLKAIDHFVRWEIETFRVGADSRVSQLADVAFDAYLKDAFVPLCAGGTMCVPEDRAIVWRPDAFADWIDASGITHLQCVPSMFRSLLAARLTADRFPALEHVLLAGEPLLPSDVDRWMGVFGERIRLANLYGPSETTLIKLFHMVTPEDRTARTVPIGKPMQGAAVLVMDETAAPCRPGVVGEIWIRTPYRTHGYYRREDLSSEVFVPNPLTGDPADLVYRTGDLGRIRDDGELEFYGRADGQVKIRGARIELSEVENVISRCRGVREAVVLLHDGDAGPALHAFVVLQGDVGIDQITRHVADWLPSYMIPSEFAALEEIPRTASGKADRKALRSMASTEAPSGAPETLTPLQQEIAAIWAAVLRKPDIRLRDNFFRLGGHSLMIFQVMARIRQRFSIEIPVADMFLAPTLEAYAEKAEQALQTAVLGDDHDPAGIRALNGAVQQNQPTAIFKEAF